LGELLCRSGEQRTISEIAQATDAELSAVAREINRLAEYGYLHITTQGRNRLVEVNWNHPHIAHLTGLLDLTYGPYVFVTEALSHLERIEMAFIFGSWAARHAGHVGPPPRDVDVLVVGDVGLLEVASALNPVAQKIGADVQPYIVSASAWAAKRDPFLAQLIDAPLVPLPIGHEGKAPEQTQKSRPRASA
jgi:hypothetical protein